MVRHLLARVIAGGVLGAGWGVRWGWRGRGAVGGGGGRYWALSYVFTLISDFTNVS